MRPKSAKSFLSIVTVVCGFLILLALFISSYKKNHPAVDLSKPILLEGPFSRVMTHAWRADIPEFKRFASNDDNDLRSFGTLFEDGKPIEFRNTPHAALQRGRGRYRHWGEHLFFSPPDNTDPNKNGRKYSFTVRNIYSKKNVQLNPTAPKIIYWFVIDALRGDMIGKKLNNKVVMPNLTNFAEDHIDFKKAYVQSSMTKLTTASWFTGLWTHKTGVKVCYVKKEGAPVDLCCGLNRGHYTLAEFLQDQGYTTFTTVFTAHTRRGDGLLQGFEYQDVIPDQFDLIEPAFIYQHIIGSHAPYVPSYKALKYLRIEDAPVPKHLTGTNWYRLNFKNIEEAKILYNQYLARSYDVDKEFDGLIKRLKKNKSWDDTLLIITSDHGEEFLEHETLAHGASLYDEVIHVPLIIKFPKNHPASKYHGESFLNRVRLIDIYPTIAEMVTGSISSRLDGQSLSDVISGEEKDIFSRKVISYLVSGESSQCKTTHDEATLMDGKFKVKIGRRTDGSRLLSAQSFNHNDPILELYDIETDPFEKNDLSQSKKKIFSKLKSKLNQELRNPGKVKNDTGSTQNKNPIPLLEEERKERLEALETLGYIQ